MTPNAPLSDLAAVLRSDATRRIAVLGHVRPDGDALGCQIALALSLLELGKEVRVWNEDGMLDKYRFLPRSELVTTPPATPEDFDLVVALDTAVFNRLGNTCHAIRTARQWINLDHHISNERYGDLVHVDPTAPATGQILYELLRGHDLPFTYEIADNLFVAISTDTGSFQYPQTNARTYEIAAELVKAGANVGALSQRCYESYPRRRLELLRALLNTLRLTCADRVASISETLETARALGAKPEDNEGLIDYIRAIQGVIVAVFFEELEDGKVRISMRSKDRAIDCSKLCGLWGGGGHQLAAGARMPGALRDVEAKVLAAVETEFHRTDLTDRTDTTPRPAAN